jgi:hypothetical protein
MLRSVFEAGDINNKEELKNVLSRLSINKEEFFNFVDIQYIRKELKDFIDETDFIDISKPFKLWRAVTLRGIDELNLNGVGIYWTYDREEAIPYWGDFENSFDDDEK